MIFPTDLKKIAKLDGLENVTIKDLPQFYRADFDFAYGKHPAIDLILRSIQPHHEFKYMSIDSRSHMLMKEMYPCIPGWHCDDFYRDSEEISAENNQPKLDKIMKEAPAIHYLVVLGDCSKTEFATTDLELPAPTELPKDKPVYFYYDEAIDNKNIAIQQVEPETLYSFGPLCFHRGQAATKNGWRYFFRVTFSNHREPKNELRYQTQVYTKQRVSW